MQKFRIQFGMIAMFIAILFLSACGNSASTDAAEGDTTEATESTETEDSEATAATDAENAGETESEAGPGPEITSAYVCQMHCEGSGSEEAGTCPKCGMDYVFNTAYHADYVCPMHCEGSGSDAEGKCPKCGMDYVANEEAGHSHG